MNSLLAVVLLASGAASLDQPDQKLLGATYIEWGVAHCDMSKIPAPTAMIASMVINGSDKALVEDARRQVSEGISSHYPEQEDACTDFYRSLSR